LTSPELSADPICESKLENDVPLEVSLPVLEVLVLLLDVLPVVSSRLVSES
jgi:hypothetical protein